MFILYALWNKLQDVATVLYEQDVQGQVLLDEFPPPPLLHSATTRVKLRINPSPRLSSCAQLGPGRFPVYGDCSYFIECLPDGRRRVLQCPGGLWFRYMSSSATPARQLYSRVAAQRLEVASSLRASALWVAWPATLRCCETPLPRAPA